MDYSPVLYLPTLAESFLDKIGPVARYALATACSLFAIEFALTLSLIMEGGLIFVFLVAVIVSAIYGGVGPGLVATCLTSLAIAFSPAHMQTSGVQGFSEQMQLGLYVILAICLSFFKSYMIKGKTVL